MKYRKKPVVIEAMQFTQENALKIVEWIDDQGGEVQFHVSEDPPATRRVTRIDIGTLEGTMTANPGDWIIKGVAGEFYPCKPDIFDASYEPAE